MEFENTMSVSKLSFDTGKHEDGHGLRLVKRARWRRAMGFRFTIHGRRREMGLGGFPQSVSLADARKLAAQYRRLAAQGVDPIKHREREKARS
jgi:hypothetical protein